MQRKPTPLQNLRKEFPYIRDSILKNELENVGGDVKLAITNLKASPSSKYRRNTITSVEPLKLGISTAQANLQIVLPVSPDGVPLIEYGRQVNPEREMPYKPSIIEWYVTGNCH
jgi:hypothetical protein